MKLYATVTDSKGRKDGRGDNDYLEVSLSERNENRFLIAFDGKQILILNYSTGEKTTLKQAIKQKGEHFHHFELNKSKTRMVCKCGYSYGG